MTSRKGLYNINALKSSEDDKLEVDPYLFSIPFFLCFIASKGSGKTTLMVNLLQMYQKRLGKKHFDKVILFSPTATIDLKWKGAVEEDLLDEKDLFEELNQTLLFDILDQIKQKNENLPYTERKRVLIILDDCADSIPMNKRNPIKTLALNHRHYNASILMVSQTFKLLPTYVRNNASGYYIFRCENITEYEKIRQELSGRLGPKLFDQVFYKATKKPFSFLCIDYRYCNETEKMFRRNISEIILKKQDIKKIEQKLYGVSEKEVKEE